MAGGRFSCPVAGAPPDKIGGAFRGLLFSEAPRAQNWGGAARGAPRGGRRGATSLWDRCPKVAFTSKTQRTRFQMARVEYSNQSSVRLIRKRANRAVQIRAWCSVICPFLDFWTRGAESFNHFTIILQGSVALLIRSSQEFRANPNLPAGKFGLPRGQIRICPRANSDLPRGNPKF